MRARARARAGGLNVPGTPRRAGAHPDAARDAPQDIERHRLDLSRAGEVKVPAQRGRPGACRMGRGGAVRRNLTALLFDNIREEYAICLLMRVFES